MADAKRRQKRRKDNVKVKLFEKILFSIYSENQFYFQKKDDFTLTKTEKAIAKHLRFKCPSKKTTFNGEEVDYFTGEAYFILKLENLVHSLILLPSGSKAVDFLLESKWSSSKAKKDPMFTNRSSCVYFMQT